MQETQRQQGLGKHPTRKLSFGHLQLWKTPNTTQLLATLTENLTLKAQLPQSPLSQNDAQLSTKNYKAHLKRRKTQAEETKQVSEHDSDTT